MLAKVGCGIINEYPLSGFDRLARKLYGVSPSNSKGKGCVMVFREGMGEDAAGADFIAILTESEAKAPDGYAECYRNRFLGKSFIFLAKIPDSEN